jgi:hypothetical protein
MDTTARKISVLQSRRNHLSQTSKLRDVNINRPAKRGVTRALVRALAMLNSSKRRKANIHRRPLMEGVWVYLSCKRALKDLKHSP